MTDLLKFKIFKMKAHEGFSISVEGVSMRPLIKEGDIISIMSQSEYGLGDVVLFSYYVLFRSKSTQIVLLK